MGESNGGASGSGSASGSASGSGSGSASGAGSWRVEGLAGVTTFLTMAYIVVVNPGILATEGTGMSFSAAMTATVLVAAASTLAMGLFARLPYALAPGMGINAFFTFSLVLGEGVSWQVALGLTAIAGAIFVLLSLTPARAAIARALPATLRAGAAAGIGLFLTFIGLKNAGVVVAHPATLVTLGPLRWQTLVFAAALALAVALRARRKSWGLLAAMALGTAGGALLGDVEAPASLVAWPDFGGAFALDLRGALDAALLPALFALLLTDLFDSVSTFVAVARATDLRDEEGEPRRVREGLLVDGFATLISGLFGTSSATTYIESAAGVEVGGRTGRTALVCGLCFVPLLFVGPAAGMVPAYATAPVLVLVGATMFRGAFGDGRGEKRAVDLRRLEELLPVFLCAVMMPLTFSITQGLLWGLVAHAVLFALVGRAREVHAGTWVLAAVAGLLLAVH